MLNIEDMAASEYGATPSGLLMLDPEPWGAIEKLKTESDLAIHNFFGMPEAKVLYDQHKKMMATITLNGGKLVELADLVPNNLALAKEASVNPNLFFTRDSSFTAPFLGKLVIQAKMSLAPRSREPAIVTSCLAAAGYETHSLCMDEDDVFEAGDAIPVCLDGLKTILLGIGERTSFGTAKAMIDELPVDQVIAIAHPKKVLHLDTGLSLYPGVAVMAQGMFEAAVKLKKGKAPQEIDAEALLKNYGFDIIKIPQAKAIDDEVCNVLPLGNNIFVGFEEMGQELIAQIEDKSNAKIHTTPGGELALAAGGVHCSLRPLFGSES